MNKQHSPEHSPSRRRNKVLVIVAGATMTEPKSVKGHRVTRLKLKPETLPKDERVRGPRKCGVLKGHRGSEPEKGPDLLPDRLCQRAREGKVLHRLAIPRAVRAGRLAREMVNACSQRQRIKEKLVERLHLSRVGRGGSTLALRQLHCPIRRASALSAC